MQISAKAVKVVWNARSTQIVEYLKSVIDTTHRTDSEPYLEPREVQMTDISKMILNLCYTRLLVARSKSGPDASLHDSL